CGDRACRPGRTRRARALRSASGEPRVRAVQGFRGARAGCRCRRARVRSLPSAANEPFSRLVAYGVQMRTTRIDPQGVATAVEISSSQGWRRPLLAWLGVQLKRAEQAGDSETAARLKRRMELVSG